jgi:DNA polymerase type B, organellar and viral
MIKGPLEVFIRQAYFGGNSDIFVSGSERFVSEGFHYDMNSQYPNAMKFNMPTGNPVLPYAFYFYLSKHEFTCRNT